MKYITSSLFKAILLGSAIGLAGIMLMLTPLGHTLEEEVGLIWLFKIRGPIPVPANVVVVSIDLASSRQLALPNKPRLWPRSLHADMIDTLHRLGAAAIFFDIIFEEPREATHNLKMAHAIRTANNVVLFQYLQREIITLPVKNGPSREVQIDHLISPLPVLRDAAFGLAPFPLPKVPAKVNHFLLFKNELGNVPTVPVALLQTYALPVYDALYGLLQQQVPTAISTLPTSATELRQHGAVQDVAKQLRDIFQRNPNLTNRLVSEIQAHPEQYTAAQQQMLVALLRTYQLPDSAYLNFYGPPRSITTIPYAQLLHPPINAPLPDLQGKIVLVGFSEEFQPEQKDGFYTVFTDERSGLDISGVEIGATAVANLLQRNVITTPRASMDLLWLFGWGLLLGIVLRWLVTPLMIPAAMMLGGALFGVVYLFFMQQQVWLPLTIPLLWQLPLAILGTILWKYREVQHERRNIREAFGYHLPIEVVDHLARGINHITDPGQHVHGIVLATDAAQYTRLSEQLAPAKLRDLLNQYYAAIFAPIRQAQGVVSDVVGDAVLALWAAAQSNPVQHQQACMAALQLQTAVTQFNQQYPATPLPTRIGLHCGEIVMGHVGAMDHFEYRAVGDIVNTATRLEGLNKLLSTRLLASTEVLHGVPGLISREIGRFLFAGKSQPITVHEILGTTDSTVPHLTYKTEHFAMALAAFRQQQWDIAQQLFDDILHQIGEDGPSRYYRECCVRFRTEPPASWDGVIVLSEK